VRRRSFRSKLRRLRGSLFSHRRNARLVFAISSFPRTHRGPGGQSQPPIKSFRGTRRRRRGPLVYPLPIQTCFCQRWVAADISQTVRVLPDLQQAASMRSTLIRSRQVEMEKTPSPPARHGREFEASAIYRQGDELARHLLDRHRPPPSAHDSRFRNRAQPARLDSPRRPAGCSPRGDSGRAPRVPSFETGLPPSTPLFPWPRWPRSAATASVCSRIGRAIQYNVAAARGPSHLRAIVDCLAQVHGRSFRSGPLPRGARAAHGTKPPQPRRWITEFCGKRPPRPKVIEHAMQMTQRHLVVFCAINQPD